MWHLDIPRKIRHLELFVEGQFDVLNFLLDLLPVFGFQELICFYLEFQNLRILFLLAQFVLEICELFRSF